MKEINLTEKIVDLLNNKNFESLNQEEKNFVLASIDKEEYEQMFELQQQLKASFSENTESPNNILKDKLMIHFDKHHSQKENKNSILKFLLLKIPVYQPIAAVFISLIFLTSLYYLNDFSSVKNERIVYKYLTDTLFIKPEMAPQQDTLKNGKRFITENKNSNYQKIDSSRLKTKIPENEFPVTLCRSIKADSDLKQFMVSM